ncbi:MAG: SGNH/GDSL hydrolase family protein, partial [Pseudomonadota bacterium]
GSIAITPTGQARLFVSRAGVVIRATPHTHSEVLGPFQGGDVATVYAERGSVDYTAATFGATYDSVPQAAVAGRTLALVGDSFTANGFYSDGSQMTRYGRNAIEWALALSNQPMTLISTSAVGGSAVTADNIGVRFMTQMQSAIASGATDIHCMGGINDALLGISLASVQAEYSRVIDYALSSGKRLWLTTQPTMNAAYTSYSVARQAQMLRLNDWLLDRVAVSFADRNLVVIDGAGATNDPNSATADFRTNGSSDNLHPRNVGGYWLGKEIGRVWAASCPVWDRRCRSNAANYGYSSVMGNNIVDNGLFTTGATPGTGWAQTYGGSASGTLSKVTRADGFGSNTQNVLTFTAADETATLAMSSNAFSRAVVGGTYVFQVEVTVAASPVNLKGVQATLQQNGDALYEAHSLAPITASDVALPEGFTATLRTPPVVLQAGKTILLGRVRATAAGATAGGITLSVGRASLLRVDGY